MGEVRFYHLTERPLESVLPVMLERSLDRGWRAQIRGTVPDRISALDTHLWTYRGESFLPHGAGQRCDDEPIWLTCSADEDHAANALFLIDGADFEGSEATRMEMTAVLFDGLDPAAVDHSRAQWRKVTALGLKAIYWAQEGGSWVKKSEVG
ncbi:MAG: DNA polymerase III subunit chi [Pseudomonadota bacterium]